MIKLGWVFISLWNSIKGTNLLFSKTSMHNYENLRRLDCLGIEENHVNSDDLVYDILRIQLKRVSRYEGHYETNLIWKESHSLLSDNK